MLKQLIFVWAGLMHPISLLIYWLWLGPNFRVADVDHPPDPTRAHATLVAAGTVLVVAGVGLFAVIGANWDLCVEAATLAGAAQAATAAVGVAVLNGVGTAAGPGWHALLMTVGAGGGSIAAGLVLRRRARR